MIKNEVTSLFLRELFQILKHYIQKLTSKMRFQKLVKGFEIEKLT